MHELVPTGTIGLLVNPTRPNVDRIVADMRDAARTLGRQIHVLTAGNEHEIDAAFADLAQLHLGSLVRLGRYSLYSLTSWWTRLAFGLPQREIVTVTTNVPGPQQPLYGMGRRLVEIIPYVPIATTLRTGIAIFTYCGTVTFGITGDFAANPDLDVLARGIDHDLSELLAAAKRHRRRAATKRRPAMTRP